MTTNNGSIDNTSSFNLWHTKNYKFVFGNFNIRLNSVTNRPSIIISDIPTKLCFFRSFGTTIFSSDGLDDNFKGTDTCIIGRNVNENTISIWIHNYVGPAPSGYVALTGNFIGSNM